MMKDNYIVTPKKEHPLINVWNDFPKFLQDKSKILNPPKIEDLIGEIFSSGAIYYYTINFADSTLSNHHNNILTIHGLKELPKHLHEIIDLIHPEDVDFVMEAERMAIEKIKEIKGFAYIQELKSSYCFRMKTSKGEYEMFHHQALHLVKDNDGRLIKTVNIHTNIHHITQKNPYTVLVVGIGGRHDFHQMQYRNNKHIDLPPVALTKRETEILSLLALGKSSIQISEHLGVSYHTVTTHRRNILAKTNSNKVSELVKKALEWGII